MDPVREQRLQMEAEEMAQARLVEIVTAAARAETNEAIKEKLWTKVEGLEDQLRRMQRRDRPLYQDPILLRYGEGAWAGDVWENGVRVR